MPSYQFKCPECDHEKEVILRLTDHTESLPLQCPKHGERTFEQTFRIGAAHDWGQGRFYRDASANGETFYSKKAMKDFMKAKGLRETLSYG